MSWKQKALDIISLWGIKFEDMSDGTMYRGHFEAPEGYFLYETGTAVHTHVMDRFKGSDKSKFWFEIYNIASVGCVEDESYERWLKECAEFDKLQGKA